MVVFDMGWELLPKKELTCRHIIHENNNIVTNGAQNITIQHNKQYIKIANNKPTQPDVTGF